MSSVAVGTAERRTRERRTRMQDRKTRAIAVDGVHRATARTAAIERRPIQGVARQNQSFFLIIRRPPRSTLFTHATLSRSIGVDLERRATARTAATTRRPIQGVAR